MTLRYEVVASLTNGFDSGNSTWSIFTNELNECLRIPGPFSLNVSLPKHISLWQHEIYIQVRLVDGIGRDRRGGKFSPATGGWTVASNCEVSEQALDVTSRDPSLFKCHSCPPGAHCDKSSTLHSLKPKMGYWRVPWGIPQVG